ncbi:MAG: PQQ-binding-like beta-propeller repeat protein [Verrucomicrobia bacterium]|nr:PQQ-binding-like beta-propeller repeat protein [Verrucomicrobiota bacterium]
MKPPIRSACLLSLFIFFAGLAASRANDWPTWRHDAGRTAASPVELPGALHLQWKHQLPRPTPTFPNDPRLCFDKSYEPVVAGKRMFVPSMVTDTVTALDTETGAERWTFFADGPVRFAPVAWQEKVYFVSDDGFLYCVNAVDGRLLWKFSPFDPERRAYKLLGDERLISRWPARGGPVLADGIIYFAAGIWPFEGVAVCAVDANTGEARWVNKDCSFVKDGQLDHGERFDGGVSPQGYLAVLGAKLIVPCGRALPAFFDRATGRMEPYTSGWGGRVALAKGSWYACGIGDWLFQSGDLYRLRADATSTQPPKPGDFVRVADFAQQMKVSTATMDRWIKQFKLDVVKRDGEDWLKIRSGDEITYLSWWTSRKNSPPRPGEQHVLETRVRVDVDPANAKELAVSREPVLTEKAMYYSRPSTAPVSLVRDSNDDRIQPRTASYTEVVACDLSDLPGWKATVQGGWGLPKQLVAWSAARFNQLWNLPSSLKVHIKAGQRLFAGASGTVAAVEIPGEGQSPKVSWRATISGTPHRMLTADGRLFVVTVEGTLYCFGKDKVSQKTYAVASSRPATSTDSWAARAAEILRHSGVRDGYCLALGVGSRRLVEELTRQAALRMIVLEPDAEKIASARREFHKLGLYGSRVHVLPGDLSTLRLAPYLASLVVAGESAEKSLSSDQFTARLFALLRPYGGAACFTLLPNTRDALARQVRSASLTGAELTTSGEFTLLARRGALPDAADWAHASGDAAHTFASLDRRVTAPLGVLWFGGGLDRMVPWVEGDPPCLPNEAEPSPYAGAGPPPRVAGGRMFVQVGDQLFASDIYTGRHLWKKTAKSLTEFAATEDSVYAGAAGNCVRLNAATGEQLGVFPGGWQEVRVRGDSLVGAAGKSLVCLDRHSGAVRWKLAAQRDGFSFAVGSDRVFCVDYWRLEHRRKDDPKTQEAEIAALKLASGEALWRIQTTTPATALPKPKCFDPPLKPQLSFSEPSDVLLLTRNQATAAGYRGATGQLLWSKEIPCKMPPKSFTSYHPPIVLADCFVTHGGEVIDIATGESSKTQLWKKVNAGRRGCGRAIASARLLTVRDGNASYCDLETRTQTFLRGIRAGCTSNLIPADGIVTAPHYSRHCNCNWPLSFSAAFVTMPEAPAWDLALSKEVK